MKRNYHSPRAKRFQFEAAEDLTDTISATTGLLDGEGSIDYPPSGGGTGVETGSDVTLDPPF